MYKLNDENLKKSLGGVLATVLTDEESEKAEKTTVKAGSQTANLLKSGQLDRIKELLDPELGGAAGEKKMAYCRADQRRSNRAGVIVEADGSSRLPRKQICACVFRNRPSPERPERTAKNE